jgi:hypothetical protein
MNEAAKLRFVNLYSLMEALFALPAGPRHGSTPGAARTPFFSAARIWASHETPGRIAGYVPAARAASVDPIEALHRD